MRPPWPSVSPLPSFCTVHTDAVPRYVSLVESFGAIWRWLWGVQHLGWRELAREDRIVEAVADLMTDAELADDGSSDEPSSIHGAKG